MAHVDNFRPTTPRHRVLVVDSRPTDAFLLRATLSEASMFLFDTTTCAPDEARDLISRSGGFDVAIIGTDPRDTESLRWMVQEIRAAAPLLPLVACPSTVDSSWVDSTAGFGLTGVIAKASWEPDSLAATVAFSARASEHERRFGTDAITGLLTRTTWNDRISHALERCRRTGSLIAVMAVDVDDFKRVNDLLGHDAGDRYLVEVARRLRATVREQDTLARLGGDEFGILLEDVRYSEAALRVAHKVLDAMSEPVKLGLSSVPVSVSIGLVLAPGTDQRPTPEWLNKSADTALYRSKETGKNRVFLFTDELEKGLLESFRFDSAVARGITQDEFLLHYQPILGIEHGELLGFEALLRWGRGGMQGTSPSLFIPVIERMGLMPAVGRAVFAEAISQLGAWNEVSTRELSMHVNLSAAQLVDRELPYLILDDLRANKVDPAQLVIEITESTLLAHGEAVAEGFAELRERGVRIAIDDFGTGYNSMVNLKQFRPDILKVDGQFVAGLTDTTHGTDLAIVRAQASLASTLGIDLVAEGVETEHQLAILKTLPGMCHGQGHFFGYPAPPETIETAYSKFTEIMADEGGDRPRWCRAPAQSDLFLRTARTAPPVFASSPVL